MQIHLFAGAVVPLLLAFYGLNASVIIESPPRDRWIETEIKTCKKYVNTSNWQQKKDVSVDDFLNVIKHDSPDDILFDVFIRGSHGARIILAESIDCHSDEPLNEIVLGDENNTHSAIYRNNKECLEEANTPDVLSPDRFRKFTIQVTHAGYVRVFASPFNIMLIEAINLKPIFIKYIVFSGIEVVNSSIEYYFDCGNAENVLSTEAPHIANTASTHMHAIAFTVVFVQLLIMRIR